MESKTIKILFFSDTHLGEDYPIRPKTNRLRRGEDFFRNFENVLQQAIDWNVDFVIHGGDLFFRTKIPQIIVDRTYQTLLDFAKSGIPIIIVPGNHESSRLPSSLLMQHPNIHIFKKPEVFNFSVKETSFSFAGFPFIRGNVRDSFPYIKGLLYETCKNSQIRFLCFHHPVEGCTVGPQNFTFRKREDTIQIKDITGQFHAYLSGHIHPHQILNKQIEDQNIPVIYPGSTERTSFAERYETKGFYLLEISNNNNKVEIMKTFNELPSRPMVEININQAYAEDELIDMLVKEFSKIPNGSIVRVKPKEEEYLNGISYHFLKSMAPDDCIISFTNSFFRKG